MTKSPESSVSASPEAAKKKVDDLVFLSNAIYESGDAIDPETNETHYRLAVSKTLSEAAILLQTDSLDNASNKLQSIFFQQYAQGGLITDHPALEAFPIFQEHVKRLPHVDIENIDRGGVLNAFIQRYTDTSRSTLDRTKNYESDGSHVGHLAYWATAYTMQHHPELNHNKIFMLGLVHDMVEGICGDTAMYRATEEEQRQKEVRESNALKQLRAMYGVLTPQFMELIDEYENQASKEARVMKVLDKFDPQYSNLANGCEAFYAVYRVNTLDVFDKDHENLVERINKLLKKIGNTCIADTLGEMYDVLSGDVRDNFIKRHQLQAA